MDAGARTRMGVGLCNKTPVVRLVVVEVSHWIGLAASGTVSCQEWSTALIIPS